jgi:hypothetical protein
MTLLLYAYCCHEAFVSQSVLDELKSIIRGSEVMKYANKWISFELCNLTRPSQAFGREMAHA